MGSAFVLLVELIGALVAAAVLVMAVLLGWFFITPPEYDLS